MIGSAVTLTQSMFPTCTSEAGTLQIMVLALSPCLTSDPSRYRSCRGRRRCEQNACRNCESLATCSHDTNTIMISLYEPEFAYRAPPRLQLSVHRKLATLLRAAGHLAAKNRGHAIRLLSKHSLAPAPSDRSTLPHLQRHERNLSPQRGQLRSISAI